MAEILIAARDLPSGYRAGDPVAVKPNGQTWGREERPPNFYVVKIPNLDEARARLFLEPLVEDAVFGDPEFNAPDEQDRRIVRHRRRVRLDLTRLSAGDLAALTSAGELSRNVGAIRDVIRKQRYDRAVGIVDDGLELPGGNPG